MAANQDYNNLFGSSDEESSDEEEAEQQQQQQQQKPAAAASAPAQAARPAAAASSAAATGGDASSSSEDESSDDEDERLSAKKRLQKKGVPLASLSSDESESEDEEEVAAAAAAARARPAPKARTTGSDALKRATADFDEEEEEEEDRARKSRAPDLSSDGSSSSSSSSSGESDSSDDEGDSRRRKKGALKKKKSTKTKNKRIIKGGGEKEKKAKASKSKKERVRREDEDGEEDDGAGGSSSQGGGGGGDSRRAGRELTVVEQALASFKRNRSQKLPDKQVQDMTQRLIEVMEVAAKEDRQAMAQHRPATQKLKRLTEVLDLLKSKHLQGALVDNGQVLGLIKQWLQPLPDKSLPLFAVRTPLIDYLLTARVEVHRLKESGVGRVIQQLKKHPEETVENKAKLTEIVDNWSRLITGKGTTLKSRTSEEEMEGREARQARLAKANAGGGGFIMSTTARGVVIPIRTGFNFKKVALTFREEFDRGQGKEDEAMEVNEREPGREGGMESRTSKVRKALKDMGRGGSKKLRHESVRHGH
jgi:transcription factor SPN1